MQRNRLYLLLGSLLTAAYVYVIWSLTQEHSQNAVVFCPLKKITGIACPSCGTTRSVLAITKGNFQEAVFTNPLGILAATIMLTLPFWLLYDVLSKKNTFYNNYTRAENYINNNKIIILFAGLLMLANWIWNINKGL